MIDLAPIKTGLKSGMVVLASCLVSTYFVAGALTGATSLSSLDSLKAHRVHLQRVADGLSVQQSALAERVSAFDDSRLDADLLEEEVRKSLGFAHPDEIIIFVDASVNR